MPGTATLHQVIPIPLRTAATAQVRAVTRAIPACSQCALLPLCIPHCGDQVDARVDTLVGQRIRVPKGETLVFAGAPFNALFAIRSGSCKSVIMTLGGQEQVAGYHIAGDIVGAEGIHAGHYECTITALEDSEFCTLIFERMEALADESREFQRSLNAMLSREIGRERKVMLMLGTMRAEQRLAAFLLDLSRRYRARGYSSTEFVLRMTREEIGSYLGLKLETVSRLFSHMHREGLVQVQGRVVKLLDLSALQGLVASSGQ